MRSINIGGGGKPQCKNAKKEKKEQRPAIPPRALLLQQVSLHPPLPYFLFLFFFCISNGHP